MTTTHLSIIVVDDMVRRGPESDFPAGPKGVIMGVARQQGDPQLVLYCGVFYNVDFDAV